MYGIEGLLAGRTLLDRYRVEEVIGRGGMGAVYRARDQRLGREVAVKVVTVAAPDPAAHQRLRSRFHREARAAAGLHHPNIVAVHDFGTDPELGLDFLVMELLRGEDLASLLTRRGPPSLSLALSVLYQAARGLAAGHRAGLIHRDVKPGNLFLEPGDRMGDVRVKVLDFGIADIGSLDDATVTQLTLAGRSPFSPAFASPEQLRGESRLTPATDVFSLGATAFQLLTGQRAFTSSDPRQMVVELSRSLAAALPRVPDLPDELRAALRRALSPFPEDRFPDAGAFADTLAPLAREGEGGRVREEDPTRRPEAEPASRPAPERPAASLNGAGSQLADPAAHSRAAEAQRLAELRELQQRGLSRASPLAAPTAPPRGGWLRRAANAVWNFVLTTTSVALFAGAWLLAINGLQEQDAERMYVGAVASVLLTPLAVHRLLGQRGSLRMALFASVVGSLAAVYFLAAGGDAVQRVLGAMFVAQVVLCFAAERLTGREPRAASHEP
jgi:serine/threonine protein kinase